jgi:hypothetical protein
VPGVPRYSDRLEQSRLAEERRRMDEMIADPWRQQFRANNPRMQYDPAAESAKSTAALDAYNDPARRTMAAGTRALGIPDFTGHNLISAAEFLPGVGDAMDAQDSAIAFGKGDYLTGGLLGGAAAIGLVPGVGDALGGIIGTMAGKGAKTADVLKLAEAQRMMKAGANRETARQATGWFQGVDGEWRFEIDDSGAIFKHPGEGRIAKIGDVLEHRDLFEAYPGARDADVAFMNLDGANGQYMAGAGFNDRPKMEFGAIALDAALKGDEAKSTLLHELQHGIQNAEGFDYGSNLQMAQAQARNYAAALKSSPEAHAARDASTDYADIMKYEASPIWAATTWDKMDHLVERGMSRSLKPRDITGDGAWYIVERDFSAKHGGMPKRPGAARDAWMLSAAQKLRDHYIQNMDPFVKQEVDRLRTEYPTPSERKNAARRAERRLNKQSAGAFEWHDTKERAGQFSDLGKEENTAAGYKKKIDAYRRNSGEAEARNVQARMNMTAEERAAAHPFRTMDIYEGDQFVGNVIPGQSVPKWRY